MNPALFLTDALAYLFGTYYRSRGWKSPAVAEAHTMIWNAREEVRYQQMLDRVDAQRRTQ